MKIGKRATYVVGLAAVALGATACGGGSISGGGSSSAAPASSSAAASSSAPASSSAAAPAGTLKIGYVTPQTGPLAGFGEADAFTIDYVKEYFAKNPLQVGGQTYNVDIITRDAASDTAKAAQAAADLINNDGVDIVMAAGTPDITNPVADACEANATPCITAIAPWQSYVAGRAKGDLKATFQWTYHFFWGLEDIAAVYTDMWNQVPTNKQVGGLYPNDPDGQAVSGAFPGIIKAAGYTETFPPLYPNGTQDFSSQISFFKAANAQILTGVPIPPDFTTFWKQAKQQGYNPKVASIAKAILFPSSVESLGDLGDGLSTEIWWSPTWPTTSSLTGISAKDFGALYEEKTGKQWTQPLGFVESLFEVAANAVTTAGSTDKAAIQKALSTLKTETLVGNVQWSPTPTPTSPTPNVAKTPIAGGQWRLTNGGKYKYDLLVVSNALAKSEGVDIPLTGKMEPMPGS